MPQKNPKDLENFVVDTHKISCAGIEKDGKYCENSTIDPIAVINVFNNGRMDVACPNLRQDNKCKPYRKHVSDVDCPYIKK